MLWPGTSRGLKEFFSTLLVAGVNSKRWKRVSFVERSSLSASRTWNTHCRRSSDATGQGSDVLQARCSEFSSSAHRTTKNVIHLRTRGDVENFVSAQRAA